MTTMCNNSIATKQYDAYADGPAKGVVEEPTEEEDSSISDGSGPSRGPSPTASPTAAAESEKSSQLTDKVITTKTEAAATSTAAPRQIKKAISLKDKGRVPPSFFVSLLIISMLQGCSGMWRLETLKSWWSSFSTSYRTTISLMQYEKELMQSIAQGEVREPKEYLQAAVVSVFVGCILYVLIGAPLKAGLWTGERASKHKLHRYLGLFYLIQYFLAWVEFINNYENGGKYSFLPHSIALNGITQGWSAYFSFKVLPHLKDAGYYSDKGVMSRDFLHENVGFTLFCVFGAVYYHSGCRETLQSNIGGRFIEHVFVFFPYVLVRPWFPTTRIKDTGGGSTRSEENKRFYEIATTMFKIFYLWAKYFLGFQINFMIFLGLMPHDNFRFIQGLHLMNTGTISIAMFLHTMRFRKILPAKFTFSFYIAQIYATFVALPYAIDTFISHPKLTLLSFSGMLFNMTRKREIHAAWCVGAMVLLKYTDIDW